MNRPVASTALELEAWLDEHGGFENGWLAHLDPAPQQDGPLPASVHLEFVYQCDGGWQAGETRTMRSASVVARGMVRYDLPPGEAHLPDHCMEVVEVIDTPEGPGLRMDVPANLQVVAKHFEIGKPTDRRERVPPRVSGGMATVSVPDAQLPTPGAWIEMFSRAGLNAAWRCFGGDAESHRAVPADYEGRYIQLVERIDATSRGLFFSKAVAEEGWFWIYLDDNEDLDGASRAMQQVWDGLYAPDSGAAPRETSLLARAVTWLSSRTGARVRTGNCELTGPEWKALIETGALPERLVD